MNEHTGYVELGYIPIPLLFGTKRPCVSWKKFQTEDPTEKEYQKWFSTRRNVAIVLRGLVVLDIDDPELLPFVIEKAGDSPMKCRTPSGGVHLWGRRRKNLELSNSVKVKGKEIDIRTDGGLAIVPPSETTGSYEWITGPVNPSELPVLRIGWSRKRKKKQIQKTIEVPDQNWWERSCRYMDKIEPAVSGQGGHSKFFYASNKAVQLAGGDREKALLLLVRYNERCEPPFSEKEILHKLKGAMEKCGFA